MAAITPPNRNQDPQQRLYHRDRAVRCKNSGPWNRLAQPPHHRSAVEQVHTSHFANNRFRLPCPVRPSIFFVCLQPTGEKKWGTDFYPMLAPHGRRKSVQCGWHLVGYAHSPLGVSVSVWVCEGGWMRIFLDLKADKRYNFRQSNGRAASIARWRNSVLKHDGCGGAADTPGLSSEVGYCRAQQRRVAGFSFSWKYFYFHLWIEKVACTQTHTQNSTHLSLRRKPKNRKRCRLSPGVARALQSHSGKKRSGQSRKIGWKWNWKMRTQRKKKCLHRWIKSDSILPCPSSASSHALIIR